MTTKITKDRDDEPVEKHGRLHLGDDKVTAEPLPAPPGPGLPLYLADAVREWDPNAPKTKEVPKEPPVEVYLAADVQAQLRRPDRWKQTVIQNLVTAGIYRPAHDDDPSAAVNDLMAWSAVPLPHEAATAEAKRR